MFYKRRYHLTVVNGKNPIIQHEYIGTDVKDKNRTDHWRHVASGESVLDIAYEVKKRGANNVFVGATFAFFTEGLAKFNQYYEDGMITKVYATNLSYLSEEVKAQAWFKEVDRRNLLLKSSPL